MMIKNDESKMTATLELKQLTLLDETFDSLDAAKAAARILYMKDGHETVLDVSPEGRFVVWYRK